MGWAAFSNQNSAAPSSWEAVPSGQPYAVVPPVPKVPHATAAAGSVGAAKATKLPVMTTAAVSANVTLKVDPQPLGGNYGPDGQVQDVFSPAFFSVPAGQRVKVTVYNYDSAGHSFTAPALGLDVWIPGGGAASPSVTTFTFHPGSAGTYLWVCGVPCDPFSMATPGYMRGEIHVVRQ